MDLLMRGGLQDCYRNAGRYYFLVQAYGHGLDVPKGPDLLAQGVVSVALSEVLSPRRNHLTTLVTTNDLNDELSSFFFSCPTLKYDPMRVLMILGD